MKTKKKLLSTLSIVCAFAIIFGGVFAFFFDSALLSENTKVGTVDVEVDGGLIHSNNLNNLNPGDNDPDVPNDYRSGTDHELSFTITNNGNKSVVTRTLIEVSGVKRDGITKLSIEELENIILSEKLNVTAQTTQNTIPTSDTGKQTSITRLNPNGFEDNKLFYVIGGTSDRGIQDVLNGTGEFAETETDVNDNVLIKTFDIGLDKDVTNDMFQGATITFKVIVQAMQYRNTGDDEWDNIFEADYTIIQPPATIPEGGTYYIGVTGSQIGDYSGATTVYSEGKLFPETVNDGDVFVYGDYEYRYNKAYNVVYWAEYNHANGWCARVLNPNKVTYGEILENINGRPVYLYGTFCNCTSMTTAPELPSGTTDMGYTFFKCSNLTTAPAIPSTVIWMQQTFDGCTSLANINNVIIPSGAYQMHATFRNCTSLTGTLTINAILEPQYYDECFGGVDFASQNLTLTGSSNALAELGATGINYTN